MAETVELAHSLPPSHSLERPSDPSLQVVISWSDMCSTHSHRPRGVKRWSHLCKAYRYSEEESYIQLGTQRREGGAAKVTAQGKWWQMWQKQKPTNAPELFSLQTEEGGPQGLNPRLSVPIPGKILVGKYQTGGHEYLKKNAAVPRSTRQEITTSLLTIMLDT